MNYADLVKSPEELADEQVKLQERQILEAQELVIRHNWLAIESTKKFIKQVEDKLLELNLLLMKFSFNADITAERLRILAVEAETVSKTLNLLKHGRYTSSADLASSTNSSASK